MPDTLSRLINININLSKNLNDSKFYVFLLRI